MKLAAAIMLSFLLLTGCTGKQEEINRGMELRSQLLSGAGCAFTANITADYGDELHQFSVDCNADSQGGLSFTVTQPDTIAGITGKLSSTGGQLTFDDAALAFPILAEDQISPVSAPWFFLKTLRSGYLTAAGMDGEYLRLTIDDSYEDDALQMDIWLNDANQPVQADILYDGCRILTLQIENFRIL